MKVTTTVIPMSRSEAQAYIERLRKHINSKGGVKQALTTPERAQEKGQAAR